SPQDFEEHLANNCSNISNEIKQKYLSKLLERSRNFRSKKNIQTKISDFHKSSKLISERINEINKTCVKVFVIYRIS
ncbi:8219_t:CDS:1, partial [Scutellospora calospora]